MTPRALLTAIGATAMAFTIAIGVAAQSAADLGLGTEAAQGAVATVIDTDGHASSAAGSVEARMTARNAPCEFAV